MRSAAIFGGAALVTVAMAACPLWKAVACTQTGSPVCSRVVGYVPVWSPPDPFALFDAGNGGDAPDLRATREATRERVQVSQGSGTEIWFDSYFGYAAVDEGRLSLQCGVVVVVAAVLAWRRRVS